MKRILAALLAVLLLCLSLPSCEKKTAFSPSVILADGYSLSGDTISARFYNGNYIDIYSDVKFSSGSAALYSDETFSEYLSEGLLPLSDGENIFYFLVRSGNESVSYKLVIENTLITSLSVKPESEKIYHIGESFDRSTVTVKAELLSGGTVEITDYDTDYAFDGEGSRTVRISCGGCVYSLEVNVAGEGPVDLGDDLRDGFGALYSLSGGLATLKSGSDVRGYYVVPLQVGYNGAIYPVAAIADYCFYENTSLTGISVGSSVLTVGECAFAGCTALLSAEFESGTSFSGYVFRDCASLRKATLPNDLSGIPDGFFSGCSALTDTFIPGGAEYIGSQAYLGCVSLEEVILPQSVASIGARAFKSCSSLKRIICGKSVALIGDGAFSYCASLLTVLVPEFAESQSGLLDGCPLVTLYSGKTSMAIYYATRDGVSTVAFENGTLCVTEYKDNYLIGEEFSPDDIVAVIMTDEYLGLAEDLTYECDFSVPGLRRIKVSGEGSETTLDVFVSYVETLSGTLDSRGAEYSLDRDSLTASLVSVPESLGSCIYADSATFILPTDVDDGENVYSVTSISAGAVRTRTLSRLFIHSGVKRIEDGAVADCPSLSLVYCGVRTGTMLFIGEDNFSGLSDDLLILCEFRNSVMHNYVRANGLKYAGVDIDTLYFIPGREAKTSYAETDKFDPTDYFLIYIGRDFTVTEYSADEAEFSYDFSSSCTVTARAHGKSAECRIDVL